jgi:hypothetical protein
VIAILAGAIFASVAVRQRSKTKRLQSLFEDARYQRALDMIKKRVEAQPGEAKDGSVAEGAFQQGFDDALAYLKGEGVSDSEARQNLQSMIEVIVASKQQSDAPASA